MVRSTLQKLWKRSNGSEHGHKKKNDKNDSLKIIAEFRFKKVVHLKSK
jgi:hypothetical protein